MTVYLRDKKTTMC